ncbi:hypothetical protein [Acidisphaera sp. L21]|uniref:hypothetical protein n=1 Tax=Acidisphaera sp. L21 TaxID=1641851 RepID=UPI00131C2AEB|nr:hypothetical protein [Acidisphaera sp. L21]
MDVRHRIQLAVATADWVLRGIGLASTLLLVGASAVPHHPPVLWAWERTEVLNTMPLSFDVAAVVGFIRLEGGTVTVARGRRFPLMLREGAHQPTGVVHIEIDQTRPLLWTEGLRAEVVGAVLAFMRPYAAVQVDMEVRDSQRVALLDVLRGVRAGRPPGTTLSMTALASWCDTEHWLAAAPVDEIVPMLFRMGPSGARLQDKLARGGDFGEPWCRQALGISTDTPVAIPQGRRVYVFNPHPWDAGAVAALEQRGFR